MKPCLINFNKRLYKLRAVKKATEDYASLADFEINQKKDAIQVKMRGFNSNLKEEIKDEFCNYVLFLTVS